MAKRPGRPHNFRALSKPKQLVKSEHKHYWPYIPLLVLVAGILFLSSGQAVGNRGVLAYATSVNANQLLDATNNQRSQNGASNLQLNTLLSSAAQAKANDMVNRNYWSHTTPDGQEPWVFMDNAGYKYVKAGENLAYGFLTSSETVTGWMNSPSHKANLLDGAYTEVGFGYANGQNYNQSGEETVVVAMYGKPQVLAQTDQAPAPTIPASEPVATPSPTNQATASQETPQKASTTPITTDTAIVTEPETISIARVQQLTKGEMPWALFGVGLITGLAVATMLIKHAAGVRHLIRESEKFVLHHPLLDALLIALILAGSFLSQTTGFIR